MRLIVNCVCAIAVLLFVCGSAAQAADDAGSLDLAAYRGQVVVVDFWASWCVPCRRSFPWMNAMTKKYGEQGLVFIGVNVDAERAEAETFLDEYPAEFAILYDDGDKSLAREFNVQAMPTSYVFDREGNRVTQHLGFKVKKQHEYEALIVETLSK